MYEVVVFSAIAAHFAFLVYLAIGGFLALRWRRTIWLHLLVVVWGIVTTTAHLGCPLTWFERWGRARAGMAPLPSEGFIAHYIVGVLYPAAWAGAVQAVVFATVLVSWAWFGWRSRRADRDALSGV